MLKDVKVELSPQYQFPELISLPHEYIYSQINDRIIEDNDYDFVFENKYLENYEKQKKKEEEKLKQELKAKAPGLSNKVLEPVRVNSTDSLNSLNKENNVEKNNICISEFEDVAPLDPWDKSKTNKDELLQLQMEMNDMSCSQQNVSHSNTTVSSTSPKQNNANKSTSNTISNLNASHSISAQSNMSYTSTYQTPPIQPNSYQTSPIPQNASPYQTSPIPQNASPYQTSPIPQNASPYQTSPIPQNASPNFQPSNPYGMPPRPLFNGMPYPPYSGQYPGPGTTEPPTGYIPSMPHPIYQQPQSYSSPIPPPLPSKPNTQTYGQSSSSKEDAIVNTIVDMGFRRELVLNGMKNYGNDKRKVIDYVMLYSYLEGRGFQPKLIDEAIFLYSFDREKCEKFLIAFMELSEMGFEHEAIKEALIFSENDRESAIDQLTKST
jgi:hypothetical protein